MPPELDLPPTQTALLFRVAQEAVRNARRHAGAGGTFEVSTAPGRGTVARAVVPR